MAPANKYQDKVNQLVEQLLKPDSAIKFFKDSGIAKVAKIKEIHSYTRTDGRRGLVMNVTEKDDSEISQIIFDVKHGQPSTDQLCECIYGAGTLCNKRILIYTGVDKVDDEYPGANVDLMKKLVRNMNEDPLGLFLIRLVVPNYQSEDFDFHVDVRPQNTTKESYSDQSNERVFREMEFWFAYIGLLEPGFYKNWTPPKDKYFHNFEYGHFTDVEDFQVREGLNNFGAFIWVVQSDGGKDKLNELWRRKKAGFKKLFPGHEMELEYQSDKSPTLTVKVSDR